MVFPFKPLQGLFQASLVVMGPTLGGASIGCRPCDSYRLHGVKVKHREWWGSVTFSVKGGLLISHRVENWSIWCDPAQCRTEHAA